MKLLTYLIPLTLATLAVAGPFHLHEDKPHEERPASTLDLPTWKEAKRTDTPAMEDCVEMKAGEHMMVREAEAEAEAFEKPKEDKPHTERPASTLDLPTWPSGW